MLRERKDSTLVGAGYDFEVDLHNASPLSSPTDLKIVESNFSGVARIKSGASSFVVGGVSDFRQRLTVDVERHFRALDPDLELVWACPGSNCTRLRSWYQGALNAILVNDHFVLRS